MSASSKKKLRREQESVKLTERQIAQQKEEKKLKIQTVLFVTAMVLVLVIAVAFAGYRYVTNSGILERNTTALTLDGNKVSNAELNYFYIDAINEFYQYYGNYAAMFGLDATKPLDQQIQDPETGKTWADNFLDTAITNAKEIYVLASEAKAKGFTLTEDQKADAKADVDSMVQYAPMYGYQNGEQYIKAIYGKGATLNGYREYYELNMLANSYYTSYSNNLTYDEAAIRAEDAANPAKYTYYSYNTYYLGSTSFLKGGTTDEAGTTTYSDAEKAAALKDAEAAAKSVIEGVKTVEEMDAKIAALEINAGAETPAASNPNTDVDYNSVNTVVQEWVTDSSRKAGDVAVIPATSTTTDADGKENTVTNGYYVVMFNGAADNKYPLINVRHILVPFEGGVQDSTTGKMVYTEAQKLDAGTKASGYLAAWKDGEATEESFGKMANEYSTDGGSNTNGGLYENVYPGQMVENFDNWCFDESRKPGDTGVVETEYGFHVMYFSGESETLFRDFLIENSLRANETDAWFTALKESVVATEGTTKYINKSLVLSSN